jgi:hypothetical protein
MDWVYLKCLRNATLQTIGSWDGPSCMKYELAIYRSRPAGTHHFEVIGGFHQHPNSSSDM